LKINEKLHLNQNLKKLNGKYLETILEYINNNLFAKTKAKLKVKKVFNSSEKYEKKLEKEVAAILKLNSKQRRRNVKKSKDTALTMFTVITKRFKRNANVIAQVLTKAKAKCKKCKKTAPFIRKKDGTPYLEIHHKISMADGGYDTIENTIAVCPNCHRELHYGMN